MTIESERDQALREAADRIVVDADDLVVEPPAETPEGRPAPPEQRL